MYDIIIKFINKIQLILDNISDDIKDDIEFLIICYSF